MPLLAVMSGDLEVTRDGHKPIAMGGSVLHPVEPVRNTVGMTAKNGHVYPVL
jgi:hypothetical protein